MVGEEHVVDVGSALADGADDELADPWDVLCGPAHVSLSPAGLGPRGTRTRPAKVSTRSAFFCLSVTSWPAMVGTTALGGTWRRPGPSRSGFFGCEGMREASILSPGRTKTGSEAMLAVGVPAKSVSDKPRSLALCEAESASITGGRVGPEEAADSGAAFPSAGRVRSALPAEPLPTSTNAACCSKFFGTQSPPTNPTASC